MSATIKVYRLDGDPIIIEDAISVNIDQNGWIEIHPTTKEWMTS